MAKIKKQLREDPEPEPWYPPNYDWNYQSQPRITKKQFDDLDNNIKTGLNNWKILNINSMGRYPVFDEARKMPEDQKKDFPFPFVGPSYKNTWLIYVSYIRQANFPLYWMTDGQDIIDPGERNKIYGVTNVGIWYIVKGGGQEFARVDMLPQGSPDSYPTDQRPPEYKRSDQWVYNGIPWTYEDPVEQTYKTIYGKVSDVCRTVKSRRV